MANKAILGKDADTGNDQLWFPCPGCKEWHRVPVSVGTRQHPDAGGKVHPEKTWEWNGSLEKPTCTPSFHWPGHCHFTIADGKLIFAGDCSHELNNKTVEMIDLDPRDEWGTHV